MKLADRFTFLGLLYRLLVLLRQLVRAQERLASAAETQLQIEALRHGVRPSRLQSTIADLEKDQEGEMQLLTQKDEEFAQMEELEIEAQRRGARVPEDVDLAEFLYPGQERGGPFD